MIKKVIFALMWIIGFSASVSAQSTAVFEGEIELETFENYSDYIKKMPNSRRRGNSPWIAPSATNQIS